MFPAVCESYRDCGLFRAPIKLPNKILVLLGKLGVIQTHLGRIPVLVLEGITA